MGGLVGLIILALFIVVVVGMYKAFSKMGYDNAWWLIIPILNMVFMLKVCEKPVWWIILMFIPIIGPLISLYVAWLVAEKVATAYGKSTGFAVGLLLLSFIFYPMLGFGSDQPQQA